MGVSYKRRLVLRGGVEVVIAKKVARLEHELERLQLQGRTGFGKSKFCGALAGTNIGTSCFGGAQYDVQFSAL